MNKKIKSGSEIKQEIKAIFDNNKNVDDTIVSLKAFVENLSGKELLDRIRIDFLIYAEIVRSNYLKNASIQNNKKFIKAYTELNPKNIYAKLLVREKIRKPDPKNLPSFPSFNNLLASCFDAVPLDIIFTCKEFEEFRELDMPPEDTYKFIFDKNKDFAKLFFFFKSNPSVNRLVEQYAYELKQQFLIDLVIRRIVPLNSIFVYFDKDKNHKENTEDFFLLLKKKIPRNTIQAAITRDLKKIIEGKFIANV